MKESDYKVLDVFRRDTITTDMIDEFMDGDYDFLVLGTYTFGSVKYDGIKTPRLFLVKFFLPKTIDHDDVDPNWDYRFVEKVTMTEMK